MAGDLEPGEAHPAAHQALSYLSTLDPRELAVWQESFSSVAISGNRLAEVCAETLRRVQHGEPVSDRYVLGLAWTIRFHDRDDETPKTKEVTDADG